MEKDVVCRLECQWFGGCLAITVLTVICVWCSIFKMVCPWRINQHLFFRIYHLQFDLCFMAMNFPFLNLRTILLCTLTTMTVFLQTVKYSSHQLQDMQTACQAQTPPNHKITEGELNDLIRDLELSKNKAELLASKLQQWNLLHHSVKVTTFRTRNQEYEQFFKTVGYFTYCKHIDGLMDAMHMRHSPERPAVWSSVKWQGERSMAILWKGFKWFSGKFQSCKFQKTCTKSDGFVWTVGVQYLAENILFIFSPGFLSIKLWWRERRTWGALPSRNFGDGAQVQREMERCHVRWVLLDDEKGCLCTV